MRRRAALFSAGAGIVAVIGIFACGTPHTSPSAALTPIFGLVQEPGNLGLPGATVTQLGGTLNGQTTTTNSLGDFALSRASDALQLQATKSGYVAATQYLAAVDVNRIVLSPTTPYAAVAGTYQVALTASPSCQLPDDARTRAYSAAIVQDNARLTITFSGAQFAPNANSMAGRIYSNSVNLSIGTVGTATGYGCFYYQDCFTENLSGGRTLTLSGTGSGTASGTTIDVQVAGVMSVTGVQPPATCSATDHHLTFSR